MDAFEGYVRGGLERAGIEVGEEEVALLRAVDAVYAPALRELQEVDLARVDAETDLDPARPPA